MNFRILANSTSLRLSFSFPFKRYSRIIRPSHLILTQNLGGNMFDFGHPLLNRQMFALAYAQSE